MDEGTGLTPEAVKELRRATDLALRATKHTAHAVGRSMAGSIATESAICGLISLRFARRRRFSCWMPPSHNLGCLERRLALWWGSFAPAKTPDIFQFSASLSIIPNKDAQGLSFVVEDVTPPRPSRHPKSGMSSSARHSASFIAFLSRMGVSTRGIALGSLHSSVRLHTSVWAKSPPASTEFSWP